MVGLLCRSPETFSAVLKSLFSSKDDREQGRGCKLGGASQIHLHLTELTQAWRSAWRQERRFIVLPGARSAASARDPGGVLSTLLTLAGGGFFLFSDKEGRLGQVMQIAPALISRKQPEF